MTHFLAHRGCQSPLAALIADRAPYNTMIMRRNHWRLHQDGVWCTPVSGALRRVECPDCGRLVHVASAPLTHVPLDLEL